METCDLISRQRNEILQLGGTIATLRSRIEELERLVDTDTLTPLPNRRRFVREVERAVAQGRRYGGEAWLMFVDLDSLKLINDTFGHLAGDAAIIHVAEILGRQLRVGDTVARIGGDEFGLLLERIDRTAAYEKASQLIATVREARLLFNGQQAPLGISIGLARLEAGDSAADIIARADRAMYAGRAQLRSAR